MERQFVHFLKILAAQPKKDVENIIQTTIDNEVKILMIYVADDYYIKQDKGWIKRLYEQNYMNSSNGGDKFYEQMAYYYNNGNQEMLRLYLISMKFGFSGYYMNFPQDLYVKYLKKVNINVKEFHYDSFNVIESEQTSGISFKYFILIPIVLLAMYFLTEFILLKKITPLIEKTYLRILQS